MWFLERVGESVERLTEGGRAPGGGRPLTRAHLNVLTPDRIPEFFIPPTLLAAQDRPAASRPAPDLLRAASRHVIQIESAEANSSEEEEEGEGEGASRIPLRANPADIIYLPESPHTRRKESLFHIHAPRHGSPTGGRPDGAPGRSPPPGLRPSPKPRASPDSDTPSSAESSPFSSPLVARSLAASLGRRACQQPALFARRSKGKGQVTRHSSLSTDECSSADSSPGASRRPGGSRGRPASTLAPPPTLLYPLDLIRWQQRLTKESTVLLDRGGLVRLSAEYMAESRRLRVRLVNGEGLYPASFEPKSVSCCVVVYLLPGKAQKQRSTIIKRSRSPIFNEDFFFEGVAEGDLESKTVHIKVLNKGSGVRRDCVMGESQLGLAAILPSIHTLKRG
ncbi:C2 calcium-dependent domain-containing protein 4C-like [Heterodontus francisci]|uniref:C2 calcium-dependent domain-containing protein 4C-like n=1 Tax=Heterodontus francisci TaxID=7792 RepID=UPI00355AFBB3